eukprot:TRINITY_DN745_c0_g1_i1.p1 TRINITY_DN745_c0_g1~~TRINITY_DN745_c0_g1_i1.p1  ORF type:complete len:601 (-),score=231.62 TRINITY_DN745_c0_g1_i1:102-1904(-)
MEPEQPSKTPSITPSPNPLPKSSSPSPTIATPTPTPTTTPLGSSATLPMSTPLVVVSPVPVLASTSQISAISGSPTAPSTPIKEDSKKEQRKRRNKAENILHSISNTNFFRSSKNIDKVGKSAIGLSTSSASIPNAISAQGTSIEEKSRMDKSRSGLSADISVRKQPTVELFVNEMYSVLQSDRLSSAQYKEQLRSLKRTEQMLTRKINEMKGVSEDQDQTEAQRKQKTQLVKAQLELANLFLGQEEAVTRGIVNDVSEASKIKSGVENELKAAKRQLALKGFRFKKKEATSTVAPVRSDLLLYDENLLTKKISAAREKSRALETEIQNITEDFIFKHRAHQNMIDTVWREKEFIVDEAALVKLDLSIEREDTLLLEKENRLLQEHTNQLLATIAMCYGMAQIHDAELPHSQPDALLDPKPDAQDADRHAPAAVPIPRITTTTAAATGSAISLPVIQQIQSTPRSTPSPRVIKELNAATAGSNIDLSSLVEPREDDEYWHMSDPSEESGGCKVRSSRSSPDDDDESDEAEADDQEEDIDAKLARLKLFKTAKLFTSGSHLGKFVPSNGTTSQNISRSSSFNNNQPGSRLSMGSDQSQERS